MRFILTPSPPNLLRDMGWIADRAFRSGSALYEGGPKKRGPLRKVLNTIAGDYSTNLFGSDIVLLECGHTTRAYGGVRAICEKCRLGQPIDDLSTWGFENPVKTFTPPVATGRSAMPRCSSPGGHVWVNSGINKKKCKHCFLHKSWLVTKRCWVPEGRQQLDCFAQEGKDAHAEGTERSDCPYGEDTDGRAGWLRGWDLAAQNAI